MTYLLIATLTKVDHNPPDEILRRALVARAEGKRSEIISDEEAKRRGLLAQMPDLTKWAESHGVG
jgi:hypothetical protein